MSPSGGRRPRELSPPDGVRAEEELGSRAPELALTPTDGGEPERVRFRPRATVSSGLAIRHLARAGAGVAALPEVLVRDELAAGALVQVLPGWSLDELGVFLVWPDGAVRRQLTGHLVGFLAPRLEALFREERITG